MAASPSVRSRCSTIHCFASRMAFCRSGFPRQLLIQFQPAIDGRKTFFQDRNCLLQ